MNKRILKLFLKAGFLELNVKYGTEEGFSQGSPISPALANFTLAGLETFLGKAFLSTRYVDDFVVLGKSRNALKTVAIKKINEFINIRGLSLNREKTKVYSIKEGFNFVGLNFREYPDKNRTKGTKEGAFIIKPSKEKVNDFIEV
jgi:RNA-directed DNA polymerase